MEGRMTRGLRGGNRQPGQAWPRCQGCSPKAFIRILPQKHPWEEQVGETTKRPTKRTREPHKKLKGEVTTPKNSWGEVARHISRRIWIFCSVTKDHSELPLGMWTLFINDQGPLMH